MPPKKPAPPPVPPPEEEAVEEEDVAPVPRTVADILTEFYDAQPNDPDAASESLASALEIDTPTTDLRNGSRVDFLVNTLVFSRDAGFSLAQSVYLHAVATALLETAADAKMPLEKAEQRFQHALVSRVTSLPSEGHFTVDDIKVVSHHFASGFFTHWNLFKHAFRNEQKVEQHFVVNYLETPFAFGKLVDAYTEESWEAKKIRDAEAAEAERVRLEEAAKLAAEETERVRKEEAETQRLAKETQDARRRPKTLDEAVEHAVREKLKLERTALEAEYGAREEQLLLKIAALEAQMK